MFCNYTSHWYIIFRNCSASVPYKSAIILEVLLRLNVFLQFHHMTNHNHSSLDEFHGGLNTEFQYFVLVLFFNAFLYSNLLEGSFQFCWLFLNRYFWYFSQNLESIFCHTSKQQSFPLLPYPLREYFIDSENISTYPKHHLVTS